MVNQTIIENDKLCKDSSEAEVTIKDLYEFYANIEAVYADSVKAMEEYQNTLITSSANVG